MISGRLRPDRRLRLLTIAACRIGISTAKALALLVL